jgi:hypothetical protein
VGYEEYVGSFSYSTGLALRRDERLDLDLCFLLLPNQPILMFRSRRAGCRYEQSYNSKYFTTLQADGREASPVGFGI